MFTTVLRITKIMCGLVKRFVTSSSCQHFSHPHSSKYKLLLRTIWHLHYT